MRLFAIALLVATAGCAPVIQTVPAEVHMQKNYDGGADLNAAVGDPVVSIEDVATRPAWEAIQTFTSPRFGIGGTVLSVGEGDRFTVVARGQDEADLWLEPEGSEGATAFISITESGHVARGWVTVSVDALDDGEWPAGRVFSPSDRPSVVASRFKAELIYGGTRNNVVRMTYREFADNFARPAFTQDLEFDLGETDVITFRSIRIQVLEAGNQGIRYRVLDDGGLPWWPAT